NSHSHVDFLNVEGSPRIDSSKYGRSMAVDEKLQATKLMHNMPAHNERDHRFKGSHHTCHQ
ncbi:MAG: hypothetical protein AAF974_03200, partial [Cyanobacteria bacterium P01_E01_bin.34]